LETALFNGWVNSRKPLYSPMSLDGETLGRQEQHSARQSALMARYPSRTWRVNRLPSGR